MALYDTSNDDSKERLRKEAERDTEHALERERLQKEEREQQHKETLKRKLDQLQSTKRQKERELGALKLEESHLEHIVLEARRPVQHDEHASGIKRIISDLTRKLEGLKRTEREEAAELQKHSRSLSTPTTKDQTQIRLETELRQKMSETDALLRELRELEEKKISTTGVQVPDTRALEQAIQTLREKLSSSDREERQLETSLIEHQRTLRERENAEAHTNVKRGPDDGSSRELELALTDKKHKLANIEHDIDATERELEALERNASGEHSGPHHDLSKEERDITELTRKKAKLESELAQVVRELASHEQTLEAHKLEMQKAHNTPHTDPRTHELENKLEAHKREQDKLTEDIKRTEAELASKKHAVTGSDPSIHRDVEAEKTRVRELEASLKKQKDEKAKLARDIEMHEAELRSVQASPSHSKADNADIERAYRSKKAELDAKTRETKRLTDALEEAKRAHAESTHHTEEEERTIRERTRELERTKEEEARLTAELKTRELELAQTSASEASTERELRAKADTASQRKREQNRKAEALEHELASLGREIDALTREIA